MARGVLKWSLDRAGVSPVGPESCEAARVESEERMRHFSFVLSSSLAALLAIAGCNNTPSRPTDAASGHDAGGTGVDTGIPGHDSGPPVDTGVPPTDTGGSTGACAFGGGCDLVTHSCPDDASGARQGCYIGQTMTTCAPAGALGEGATCTDPTQCDEHLTCVVTSAGATMGTCVRVCCSVADCGAGETCNPLGDGTGTPLPNNIGTCHRPTACTPVPNTGCTGTDQCVLISSDGTTDCTGSGTLTEGTTCGGAGSTDSCAPGLGCYGTEAAGFTCSRFCRLAMGATNNPDCTGTLRNCATGFGSTFGLCR